MGIGRSRNTLTDAQGQLISDTRSTFVPAKAGIELLLKPMRWGEGGDRGSLTPRNFEDDFNGWYYCYRLNLFVGTIWAVLRHRGKQKNPSLLTTGP